VVSIQSDDIVAIEQLLYRDCFALDKGTGDYVVSLFHESATLVVLFEGGAPIKGRAAIREWFANLHNTLRASVDHMRHCVTNPAIEVSDNRATAQAYWTADFILKATGKPIWIAGHYWDTVVKEEGRWLFEQRQIHRHYATESSIHRPTQGTGNR
jgi:hypothetical protein